MDDAYYMRKAIAMAERGRATTTPNPMVGALVVDDEGVIVGRGWHRAAGGPHAEIIALENAGGRARGATLYCTLEPCTHVGRTGPCAPVVADAAIRRAVIAIEDPNPLVNGSGLTYLRERGIDVVVGVGRDAAARQNERFLTNVRFGRPLVILKAALSLDGCLSAGPGARTQLTGPAAARFVHRQRAEVDAIAVGSGTIAADDPLLTARGAYRGRPLTRVIFDRRLRIGPHARVLSTREAGPVIIVSTRDACEARPGQAAALADAGAEVLPLTDPSLGAGLSALKDRGVTSIVLEGGATLHRAALDAGVVDLVQAYIAPRLLGPSCLKWMEAGRFSLGQLNDRRVRWFENDLLVEGHVHGTH
jgi:diaminohydroxyphosphoribosylaminopyrimidine deaminase/5-amino-6-(5-phosphoribosylamino)uracil reductase